MATAIRTTNHDSDGHMVDSDGTAMRATNHDSDGHGVDSDGHINDGHSIGGHMTVMATG